MKVIICGAGQVGSTIARHLATERLDVTVIDIDPKQVRQVDESYDVRGIHGHASHPGVLEQAGAADADMLIAVTRSDEVNMVACQVAYSLFGVKRRIARLRHSGYLAPGTRQLYAAEHLPIDVIISPEIEVAEGIARRLRAPGAFDMVPMAEGRVQLLGIHCNNQSCAFVGARCDELSQAASAADMVILAIIRGGEAFIPTGSDQIQLNDDVYVVARTENVDEVMAAFGHTETVAERLVIVGGGNIGFHLASKIGDECVSLSLIERDKERAELIARELGSSVVVLHGDALDRELLEEAGIDKAETVVAVTNEDETNIFTSVLARKAGCPRAITLVNKRSYEVLMPMLGIDAAVSPSAITISTVLRHVRHGAISAVYTVREDFGEVIEAEVSPTSRMAGVAIGELDKPRGMVIGSVVRHGVAMMPETELVLRVGDHIVALVTYDAVKKAEVLLGRGGRSFGLK